MDRHTPELRAWHDNDPAQAISKLDLKQKFTFTATPLPVQLDPGLSPESKQVYGLLHTRNFNPRVNGPRLSEPLMAAILGLSLDKIKMAVRELRASRLVYVGKIPREAGMNNEYHIQDLAAVYGKNVCNKFLNSMNLPIWTTIDEAAHKYAEFRASATSFLQESKIRFTNEKRGVHLSLVERPAT